MAVTVLRQLFRETSSIITRGQARLRVLWSLGMWRPIALLDLRTISFSSGVGVALAYFHCIGRGLALARSGRFEA